MDGAILRATGRRHRESGAIRFGRIAQICEMRSGNRRLTMAKDAEPVAARQGARAPLALDSRITLHKLEVFDLVVECGSVSRAADQLYISQPVVTAHIRSLEQRI